MVTGADIASTRVSPFQGLRPFDEDDADFFFGRDEEADVIIANLRASRLTVLYGPSGVGKTSLLRAGVETRLRARARANFERLGTPEFVPVVFDSWQDDPLPGLARAITDEAQNWSAESAKQAGSLRDAIVAASERTDGSLLVILDQFEDLSLYHGSQNGASAFIAEFPKLVTDRRLRVNFLISIREDAIAQLDRFRRSIPGLLSTRFRVHPLTGEAARAAVTGPIAHHNELVEPNAQVMIEEALVDVVLSQVEIGKVRAQHAGQGTVKATPSDAAEADHGDGDAPERFHGVEASYLQLVMQRLWDHEIGADASEGDGPRLLRLQTLDTLGGAQKIVREHLQVALGDLSRAETETAVDVLQYLVTPDGTKITQGLSTLAKWSDHPRPEVAALLAKLQGDARIIRLVPPEPGTNESRYEIFHDVLAGAVLEWSNRETDRRRLEELATQNAKLEKEKEDAERRATLERRRRLVAVVLLSIAAAAIVAAVLFWQSERAQKSRAEHAKALAAYTGLVSEAVAVEPTRPDVSVLLALQAAVHAPTSSVRSAARAALIGGLDDIERSGSRILHGPLDTVTSVASSGDLLAAASSDGTIHLYDARTLRPRGDLSTPGHSPVYSVSLSPDGRVLASAGEDGLLRLWNVSSRKLIPTGPPLDRGASLVAVAFSPNGQRVAAADAQGRVAWWNYRDVGRLGARHVQRPLDPGLRSIAFSPDSELLAAAGDTQDAHGRVRLWSLSAGSSRIGLSTPRPLYSVAFAPAGHELAGAGLDGAIWLVDPRGGSRILVGTAGSAIQGVAFNQAGRLATADADGSVQEWDIARRRLITVLDGHAGMATSVAFTDDGGTIASGSIDRTVRLWRTPSTTPFQYNLDRRPGQVPAVAYAPSAGLLAYARRLDNTRTTIELVDPHRPTIDIPTYDGTIRCLAFSSDGRLLVSGSANGIVQLWDARTGSRRGSPLFVGSRKPEVAINSVAFSPRGPWVAFSTGLQVRLENVLNRTWQDLAPGGGVYALAFNRDGTLLAAGRQDKTITVTSLRSGRTFTLRGHTDAVFALAFSPTAPLLASGSADDTIRLWNIETRRPLGQPLTGHSGYVRSLAFAPHASVLASGSFDRTVRLWDIGAGADLGQGELADTFRGAGPVNSLAFNASGNALFTGGRDGTLRRWYPIPGSSPTALTTMVCGLVGSGLSSTEQSLYAGGINYRSPCP